MNALRLSTLLVIVAEGVFAASISDVAEGGDWGRGGYRFQVHEIGFLKNRQAAGGQGTCDSRGGSMRGILPPIKGDRGSGWLENRDGVPKVEAAIVQVPT